MVALFVVATDLILNGYCLPAIVARRLLLSMVRASPPPRTVRTPVRPSPELLKKLTDAGTGEAAATAEPAAPTVAATTPATTATASRSGRDCVEGATTGPG
jgi:hypothetical protein